MIGDGSLAATASCARGGMPKFRRRIHWKRNEFAKRSVKWHRCKTNCRGLVGSFLSAGEDEKALDETVVGQTRSLSAQVVL